MGGDCICFQDIDTFASGIPENDDTIDMRIFCNGGSVIEGWAIYDRLRQSGKKITCTIEGKAASMATIIMLAAPKESRRAYENASLLLHNPYIPCWALGGNLTAKELTNRAEEMQMWQDRMVNAYVERCGCDRNEIQTLMDKDMWIDTKESIRLGLISEVIPAISASAVDNITQLINSTKKNPKAMAKENEKVEVKASLLDKALAKLGLKKIEDIEKDEPNASKSTDDVKAMKLETEDGQTINVEREEGEPQVGDKASPDGTFKMPDGKTITIKDGEITNIETGGGEGSSDGEGSEGSATGDTVAALQEQVASLTTERDDLKAKLQKAEANAKTKEDRIILNAVKMAGGAEKVLGAISSGYQPAQRTPSGKNASEKADAQSRIDEGAQAIIANLRGETKK